MAQAKEERVEGMVGTETMDTDSLTEFRNRAQAWLEANAPRRRAPREEEEVAPEVPDEALVVTRSKEFQGRLYDAGFAAITWPKEYGGRGLTVREQLAFAQEASAYELPTAIFGIGIGMCGPTLLAHGTEEQKSRYIRPLARGDEVWCQLFSEPGAGSDVASLQTRATRDGQAWLLNGQKVWTSGAHRCDFGIVIARTDPEVPKHRGISMFIVDMKSPGVTIKPLKQMNGDSSFNEVFFTDVSIPKENLVGEENEGWRAAITMLMNERVAIGAGTTAGGRRAPAEVLFRLAREKGLTGDPVIRQRLADVWINHRLLYLMGRKIQEALRSGRPPGPEGSLAKLAGAQLAMRTAELGVAIAGAAGAAWESGESRPARWAQMLTGAPGAAIAGGTNEIMHNIIGERVLGLPKEPQVDREIPFRDLKVGTQRPDRA